MSDDGFTQMIDDAIAFYSELERNNSKDWFAPRKDHYNEKIKKPAEFFASLLADDFSNITGLAHKSKVFRIYRDVRFSKDKTPLNAHLHIFWNHSDQRFSPAFFFSCDPSGISVGAGIMGLKGEDLTRYRAFVDKWGGHLEDAIEATGMTASDYGDAPLKRVPSPYAQDHPYAELLKQKKIVLGRPAANWREDGIYKTVKSAFNDLEPLRVVLSKHLS
jgi:uncharacterized protein (TIGR02453 family)